MGQRREAEKFPSDEILLNKFFASIPPTDDASFFLVCEMSFHYVLFNDNGNNGCLFFEFSLMMIFKFDS
jgi:hypothetical protein